MNLYNIWVSLSEMSNKKYWPFSWCTNFLDLPVFAIDFLKVCNFARCVCVCVCVWERERVTAQRSIVCVCVCVWERERGRHGHTTAACVQTHTSFITVSVTRLSFPLGLELMVKPRTLLTVFAINLKAEARDYGKGRYISDAACGVRPITMHCASWPIRADWAFQEEGLCV